MAKKKFTPEQAREMAEARAAGATYQQLAERFGCSHPTIGRYVGTDRAREAELRERVKKLEEENELLRTMIEVAGVA